MNSSDIITETPSLSSSIPNAVNSNTGVSSPEPKISSTPSISSEEPSMWNSILKYGLIILILAFLGFNLFTYLGQITGGITNLFGPAVSSAAAATGETIKQTSKMAATGTKGLVDAADDTVEGGIDILEKGLSKDKQRNNNDNSVEKALSDAKNRPNENLPEPDDAGSRTQSNRALGKSGYCYIGEDRGFRSCISVGENDTCMSGDIFPTEAICINPNLRK